VHQAGRSLLAAEATARAGRTAALPARISFALQRPHRRRSKAEEERRPMTIQPPLVRLHRVVRCIAASSAVGLLLGVAGCSMSDEQESASPASAEMQPDSFTFAPPDGMRGVRTEHRRYEVSLVGAPLRNLAERELRWNIESKRAGDQFTLSQELAHVTIKQDGETVVDKDVAPGAVVAQAIIDKAGNLIDVRGLEGASKALQALAASDPGRAAGRALSPQALKALVAIRYQQTVGDVVGRSTKAGTSWTTQGRPGGPILARTVAVEKMEPCGPMMCADLQAVYTLNPRMMITVANDIAADYARWAGVSPSKMNVQSATYSMQGTLLTEPATMVNHGASLDETGKVLFEGPKHPMEIDLEGKTEISFEYATPVAVAPSPSPAPVAAQP
jgi:hypothetical protein